MLAGAGGTSIKHFRLSIQHSQAVFTAPSVEEGNRVFQKAKEHQRIGETALIISRNLSQNILIPDSTRRPLDIRT